MKSCANSMFIRQNVFSIYALSNNSFEMFCFTISEAVGVQILIWCTCYQNLATNFGVFLKMLLFTYQDLIIDQVQIHIYSTFLKLITRIWIRLHSNSNIIDSLHYDYKAICKSQWNLRSTTN